MGNAASFTAFWKAVPLGKVDASEASRRKGAFYAQQHQEDNRMMDATKYAPGYYPVPAGYDSWVKKTILKRLPHGAAWTCGTAIRH